MNANDTEISHHGMDEWDIQIAYLISHRVNWYEGNTVDNAHSTTNYSKGVYPGRLAERNGIG